MAEVNPAVPGWEVIPDDQPLTFLPLEAVWPGRMDYSRQRPKAKVASGYTRFCEGDVIVPKITPTFQADRSTLIRGMPTRVGTGTTELHVIRPSPMIDARYLDYLVSSRPFLLGGEASMTGVAGQKRVPDQWIRDFPVPVTDPAEQRTIVDYLDTETSRLDALIIKKRRMIELLEERSRSAVVKRLGALNGQIAHLSHVARIYSGSGFPIIYQGNATGDYPFFKVGDLALSKDGRWIDSAPNYVNRAIAQRLGCRLAPVGSVLFPKVGAALLGNQRRITGVMAAFDNNLMAVTSSMVEPRYLRYALTLVDLGALANPGPVPSVNEGVVASLPIKIPSFDVQVSVADELDTILDAHGRLTSLHELEIHLLAERRQALITAAVTGELPVPAIAVCRQQAHA